MWIRSYDKQPLSQYSLQLQEKKQGWCTCSWLRMTITCQELVVVGEDVAVALLLEAAELDPDDLLALDRQLLQNVLLHSSQQVRSQPLMQFADLPGESKKV